MKTILNRLIPLRLLVLAAMIGCILYGLGHRDANLRDLPSLRHEALQADISAKMAVWTLSVERLRAASAGMSPSAAYEGSTAHQRSPGPRRPAGPSMPVRRAGPGGAVPPGGVASLGKLGAAAGGGSAAPLLRKAEDQLMALGTADGRRCAAALDLYEGRALRRDVFHPLIQEAPGRAEAQVWMAVADAAHHGAAGAHLSPEVARRLQVLSEGWKIGWYRSVLLAAVFRLAKDRSAAGYESEAVSGAARSASRMIVMGVAALVIAVAGVILLIVTLVNWKDFGRIDSPLKDTPALPLIEGACFWIWMAVFAVHYALGGIGHITADTGLALEIALEVALGCGCVLLTRIWLTWNGVPAAFPAWRGGRAYLKDAAWGACGYLVLAPLMFGAAMLSVHVFGTGAPPKAHPAPSSVRSTARPGSGNPVRGIPGSGYPGGAEHAGSGGEKAEFYGKRGDADSEQQGSLIRSETPDNPAAIMMARLHRPEQLAMIFFLAVIVAPIFEERFFRGALYPALRRRLPVWAAAGITGAIFAGIHPQLPLGFAPIFVLGAGFCLLYELRGTTAASVTAHALNNAVVFAAVLALTAK